MKCFLFIVSVIITYGEGQETRKEYPETEDKIVILESAVLALSSRLSSSEEENAVWRERSSLIAERLTTAEEENSALQVQVATFEERLTTTGQENAAFQEQVATLDERLTSAEEENSALQVQVATLEDSSPAIAFTARAQSGLHEYAHVDAVIFSTIITNIGGHYDSSTSTFTCPVDGTYLFAVNFVSDMYEQMHADIVKEGVALVLGYADGNRGAFSTGSAMGITACSAQEQVWVSTGGTGLMRSDRSGHFSGFLLYPGV